MSYNLLYILYRHLDIDQIHSEESQQINLKSIKTNIEQVINLMFLLINFKLVKKF